jgi:hypothetical protein
MQPSELVSILQTEKKRRDQVKKGIRWVLALTAVSSLFLLVQSILKNQFPDWSGLGAMILLTTGIAAGATPGQRLAAEQAKQLADPQLLPELLDLLDAPEEDMQKLVAEAILVSAAAMTAETSLLLTATQASNAVKAYEKSKNPELSAALIAVVKRFAGSDAISPLEQVAVESAKAQNADLVGKEVPVRMALAEIRMRTAQATISQQTADAPADQTVRS